VVEVVAPGMPKKFYITTPIYYASAPPHIGHMYTSLLCDVLARYHRMRGGDVFFLTGTDEHGLKVYRKAQEAGVAAQKFCDDQAARYQMMNDVLDISNDDFIRTTEERHKLGAQGFWNRSLKNGDIYKKKYKGLYCVGCEAFKIERELIDGKCPDHNAMPEEVLEENYFFRLSSYTKKLAAFYEKDPAFVVPKERRSEMLSLIKAGLEDVSVSRHKNKQPWGIPVPNDPSQVMYVWFDALTNYLTAIGFCADLQRFKKLWPADLHVVGKEINRFHSLLWPAMLWSAGFKLPKQIAVHGWITVDGSKMSKTRGNVIDPLVLVDKYGVSAVRYFFMREMPPTSDGDFSFARLEQRYSADLANGIGNLFYRILSMIEKYCNGVVPKGKPSPSILPQYEKSMEDFRPDFALEVLSAAHKKADSLINKKEPWKLAGSRPKELGNFLFYLASICYQTAWLIYPFMPVVSEEMFNQLGCRMLKEFEQSYKKARLKPGTKIKKTRPLFPRLVK
jgi:methionyl-tRNA synthetase